MIYAIRITEASGDVVSTESVEATNRVEAERRHTAHWNHHHGHTADRYRSELLEDDQVVMTIGGWHDEEEG